jgi:uncharacterized protein (TIGR03067 family)
LTEQVRSQRVQLRNAEAGLEQAKALLRNLGGEAGADAEAANDRERLQGSWLVTKTTMGGRAISDRGLDGARLTFRGDELTWEGHEPKERHTFRLDTDSVPKAMFTDRVDPARPQSGWMIYELNGDRVKIGFNDALRGKPENFAPRPKLIVLELIREPKAAKEGPAR